MYIKTTSPSNSEFSVATRIIEIQNHSMHHHGLHKVLWVLSMFQFPAKSVFQIKWNKVKLTGQSEMNWKIEHQLGNDREGYANIY